MTPESIDTKALILSVSSKWFDYSILLFIFANCITIAMERPTLAEDSIERHLLKISNHIFTSVFLLEMMIKGDIVGSTLYLTFILPKSWHLDSTAVQMPIFVRVGMFSISP